MSMSRSSEKTTHPFDEGVAEAIAEALRPEELPAGRRAAMLDRISGLIADQPPQTRTIRADGVDWISFSPHVWVKTLRRDADRNLQMVLFRMEPGGVVPAHEHTKEEECLVLEGEIFIGDHRVGAGDLHIAGAGAAHGDITTRTGALVMVRSEIPPRLLRSLRAGR
jgi:quercetin dioxygenase-like cupin family protein